MLGCLCARALCSPCTQVARRTLHSVPHQRRGVPLPRLLTRIHPPARAAASRPSSELPKASRHRFPCSRPSRRAAEGTEDVTSTRRRRARTSEAEGARGVPGAAQRGNERAGACVRSTRGEGGKRGSQRASAPCRARRCWVGQGGRGPRRRRRRGGRTWRAWSRLRGRASRALPRRLRGACWSGTTWSTWGEREACRELVAAVRLTRHCDGYEGGTGCAK